MPRGVPSSTNLIQVSGSERSPSSSNGEDTPERAKEVVSKDTGSLAHPNASAPPTTTMRKIRFTSEKKLPNKSSW